MHDWAVNVHREFVISHLEPWNRFCDENYLLDWDSVYDTSRQRKRKRTCGEDEDLPLPDWVGHLNEIVPGVTAKVQARAKESLVKALAEEPQKERWRKSAKLMSPPDGWNLSSEASSVVSRTS